MTGTVRTTTVWTFCGLVAAEGRCPGGLLYTRLLRRACLLPLPACMPFYRAHLLLLRIAPVAAGCSYPAFRRGFLHMDVVAARRGVDDALALAWRVGSVQRVGLTGKRDFRGRRMGC